MESCPFCNWENPGQHRLLGESENFFASYDANPVSAGHFLVVPKRHEASFFALSPDEVAELYALMRKVCAQIQAEYDPQGFNIGLNEGKAAGQTISHCHVHVIPRYAGDLDDPRGGIRHVIPGKGSY